MCSWPKALLQEHIESKVILIAAVPDLKWLCAKVPVSLAEIMGCLMGSLQAQAARRGALDFIRVELPSTS